MAHSFKQWTHFIFKAALANVIFNFSKFEAFQNQTRLFNVQN